MNQTLQPSASSKGLEHIVQVEPLSDVSLVIVHVNEHYDSVQCSKAPISKLLEARVASHVYEHSAFNESFLASSLGLDWRQNRKYEDFELNRINYHIIDNETDPKNYEIQSLQGRRLIIVGGGVDNCHKSVSDAATKQLYESLLTAKVNELHLPVDCIYKSDEGYEGGDTWPDIIHNYNPLLTYTVIMKKTGKSYLASVDRKVVQIDMSVEEPTLHLAVWTSSDKMISYLRNHDRLKLNEAI
jgi:hypothetical protein